MGDKSKIQWTDATWNVTYGCTRVSAGCDNCYAVAVTQRLAGQHESARGLVGGSGARRHFNGRIRLLEDRLAQPLRWRRPRRVFVNSLSDLFHPAVPESFLDRVFVVMTLAQRHTFQVLTKRPERMAEYMRGAAERLDVLNELAALYAEYDDMPTVEWPPPNIWCGTSIEDQRVAHRIFDLFDTPAAVRFLSCEPLIGPLDLRHIERPGAMSAAAVWDELQKPEVRLDWVIVGGESGPRARHCHVEWVRRVVADCQEGGVPVFVKQLGAEVVIDQMEPEWRPFAYRPDAAGPWVIGLADRKGGDPEEWPEDLRVREFPEP